jgi:hypothetical protein
MTPCSRCGHRDPNPGCYVCSEEQDAQEERGSQDEEERKLNDEP